ncbi:MAG: ABC-F family ATP-binding cassette domain-containing protein [Bacteroidales bacterium]|nr:ABC-F family ATP-binding cassette domain-containing protein [Bacteroidales bacterium]MDD4420219.1 ABC-F family ATP-binding cassette domain-containing protein [Bacteroidales bacterium]
MITVTNLTVAFGGFTLLDDINFHVNDNDKVGLVGKNGAGKSTLLKIILGEQSPSSGAVLTSKKLKFGYLPQQMEHAKDKSVMEETLQAFNSLFDIHKKIDEINIQLGNRTDYDSEAYKKLIIDLNNYTDRSLMMESEPPRVQAERVLLGLGFKEEEFERSTNTLSQGWNMRIELAKVLLSKPDALLLDEPTNHLDIESIQWFEDYLKNFKGSVVLISHDRKFLDNITKRTVEIMLGKIYDYDVPYSKYKILRKERMEQQRAAYENQQRMIEKTEDFIARFRYKPTKSNQVQSRIKALDKLDRIEVDLEDTSTLNVKFPPAPRSGNVVFKCEDAQVGYGEKIIVNNVNITVERGEKVAFVGRNGEGKTTLMKVIINELTPITGSAALGYNVSLGYYAQNQEDILDKNDTVYGTLDKIAVGDVRTKLRDILAAFLFRGEDIDKKVAVLSGGERARLAMAKLILKPYNLLALDEPTNHMDILSKDVLKQALLSYDGTLIMVSHDRDFLDGLVSKVYEFKDGRVREHLGGIQAYLEHNKEEREVAEHKEDAKIIRDKKNASPGTKKSEKITGINPSCEQLISPDNSTKKTDSQQFRAESKEVRKKKKEIEKCENEIADLDHQLSETEIELSAKHTTEELTKLSEEYQRIKSMRDSKMEEWMKLSE